jgi:4-amino-4-deoxy-L-arabinose transferase-like glycosyltransferase
VALSLLATPIGYLALVAAFRRILGGEPGVAERRAVVAALLVHLSPIMLVQGGLALSDPIALAMVSLLLWAGACLLDGGGARAAIATGVAASAAIGCRPQLLVPVLPALAVLLVLRRRVSLALVAAGAFALLTLAWLLPLVQATGGWSAFLVYETQQMAQVAARDAGSTRHHRSVFSIAAHFLLDPWGWRPLGMLVLLLAIAGAVLLHRERRRATLPLLVLAGLHLAFAIRVMDPGDGARYALPALPAVALGLLRGLELVTSRLGRPRLAPLAAALVVLGGLVPSWPLVAARATALPPPAQALVWAQTRLPPDAWVMVSPELRAHAEYGLRARPWFLLGDQQACLARPARAPIYLLAEGESDRARAVVFRWPACRSYARLTRNHYRIVSLAPVPHGACRQQPAPRRHRVSPT